jgi:hypothetical protein
MARQSKFDFGIKAKQALLRLEGSDHRFKVAARHVADKLPNNFIETIATQRSRTKLNNTEKDRSDYLTDMLANWEGEIQRKGVLITNVEAANLYAATIALIAAYADDRSVLRIIAKRCLTATKTHAAALTAV